MAKIEIIGGGVIGSSIAYYLALAGAASDVIVIEPDPTYEFAATPRATGGIRQLFTVPENIRMAQYGHDVYGQFETPMAVGGDIAPIDWKVCLLSLRSCGRPRLVAWICSGATRCRGMAHDAVNRPGSLNLDKVFLALPRTIPPGGAATTVSCAARPKREEQLPLRR
jgi:FAD dependent oxidoreductase